MVDDRNPILNEIDGEKEETEKSRCICLIPRRYILTVMMHLGIFAAYTTRVNLNVAIVAMVASSHSDSLNSTDSNLTDECPDSDVNATVDHQKANGEFLWSEGVQGIILGSFFYGYVAAQLPSGPLVDIFGGKRVIGVGMLVCSALTLLTPVVAHWGSTVVIVIRILEGICQASLYPAIMGLAAQWYPVTEKSTLLSLAFTGAQTGTIVSLTATGYLSEHLGGWPSSFYTFGTISSVWCVLWFLLISDSPEQHRFISSQELLLIQTMREAGKKTESGKAAKIPWKPLLKSAPVWAIIITYFGVNWTFYLLLTDLPKFLDKKLHFSLTQNGIGNSLLYLTQMVFTIPSGKLADFLIKRNPTAITRIRKTIKAIAAVGLSASIGFVALVGCDRVLAMVLFCSALAAIGFVSGGTDPVPLDLAPDFAGTSMGFINGVANAAGMLAPLVTGYVTNNQGTMAQWRLLFYISSAMNAVGSLIFLWLGSAEPQPWGLLKPKETSSSDKNGSVKA